MSYIYNFKSSSCHIFKKGEKKQVSFIVIVYFIYLNISKVLT